jgi:hypothetical protein
MTSCSKCDKSKKGKCNKCDKNEKENKLKVYCGIQNPIPRGTRLGSMKECADHGKIMYYGIKQIDRRTLNNSLKLKENDPQTYYVKMSGIRGLIARLKRELEASKTPKEKQKIENELEKAKKNLYDTVEQLKKVKERNSKKIPIGERKEEVIKEKIIEPIKKIKKINFNEKNNHIIFNDNVDDIENEIVMDKKDDLSKCKTKGKFPCEKKGAVFETKEEWEDFKNSKKERKHIYPDQKNKKDHYSFIN